MEPSEIEPGQVGGYDLVGFGSGIYGGSFDPELRRFVASLPPVHDKPAFVFATSGFGRVVELPIRPTLAKLVRAAGYHVLGSFSCPGLDTWLPLRIVGGINKGRPNDDDLARARQFARHVSELVERRSASTAIDPAGLATSDVRLDMDHFVCRPHRAPRELRCLYYRSAHRRASQHAHPRTTGLGYLRSPARRLAARRSRSTGSTRHAMR